MNRHTPLSAADVEDLLEREKSVEEIVEEVSQAFRKEADEIMGRTGKKSRSAAKPARSDEGED